MTDRYRDHFGEAVYSTMLAYELSFSDAGEWEVQQGGRIVGRRDPRAQLERPQARQPGAGISGDSPAALGADAAPT